MQYTQLPSSHPTASVPLSTSPCPLPPISPSLVLSLTCVVGGFTGGSTGVVKRPPLTINPELRKLCDEHTPQARSRPNKRHSMIDLNI